MVISNREHISPQSYSELEQLNEPDLVECAKRNRFAFDILYERNVGKIYSYIYYRVGNQLDAEDLTAQTFKKALDHIKNYSNRGAPFAAWLFKIAHNLVANWLRNLSRRKELSLDEDPERYSSRQRTLGEIAESNETKKTLEEAVRRLPADYQKLLVLKTTEGLSNAEIGAIMGGRSEGAIKSLYHRTLIALREDLDTRGLIG